MPGGISICKFDEDVGMFLLIHCKGKSLSSGGYGVTWNATKTYDKEKVLSLSADKRCKCDNENENSNGIGENVEHRTANDKQSAHDYLFVEEALFLHERGLLQVLDQNSQQTLNTKDIYHIMLDKLRVPLPIYLVYSHLRSQTFIVVRHTVKRLDLIRQIEQYVNESATAKAEKNITQNAISFIQSDSNVSCEDATTLNGKEGDSNEGKEHEKDHQQHIINNNENDIHTDLSGSRIISWKKQRKNNRLDRLRQELRQDAFHAPTPQLLPFHDCEIESLSANDDNILKGNKQQSSAQSNHSESTFTASTIEPPSTISLSKNIAFDVYKPNASYRKTNPGPPDYYVSITYLSTPSPPLDQLQRLIQFCEGKESIPLRVATVADGGTVVMFGLTDFGVPNI